MSNDKLTDEQHIYESAGDDIGYAVTCLSRAVETLKPIDPVMSKVVFSILMTLHTFTMFACNEDDTEEEHHYEH